MNKKKIIKISCSIIMLLIILFESIYIKYQHDIILKISNSKETTSAKSNTEKTINADKEIKIGEPFMVNTSNGDYKITIEKAIKTDEYNNKDKNINNNQMIVELFLECENISFQNEKYKGVVMHDAFNVKDNNNYNLKPYYSIPESYENEYYEVLPNSKSKICLSFFADKSITSITITFSRGGRVTIPLE
jgi:hypothetical protein